MAIAAWLLLGLVTIQTAAGRDIHSLRDAGDTLISESVDWREFNRDDNVLPTEWEDWTSSAVRRSENIDEDDNVVPAEWEDVIPSAVRRSENIDEDDNTLPSESEEWISPVFRRTANINEDNCGVPAIAPNVITRVTGGVETVPHSWPWMVSLEVNGHHGCGGSLINNEWVLTAAHCRWGLKFPFVFGRAELRVVVGQHRKSQPDSFTVRVAVSKIIISPKFMNVGKRMFTSDVMLLKLAHPVEFNDAVSPVCLPSPFQVLPAGKRCFSTGWGWLSTGRVSPDALQQVMLPIIDNEVCNQPTWHNNSVDDSMICAGYQEGGLGNCKGDSGGPLVCHDGERWILHGMVSWGPSQGCAGTNKPTVYARASAYINWITETMNENSD